MIVTSCAVPILVLVLFLWTAHMLLGVKVEIPIDMLHQKARNARREARKTAASVRKSMKNKNKVAEISRLENACDGRRVCQDPLFQACCQNSKQWILTCDMIAA